MNTLKTLVAAVTLTAVAGIASAQMNHGMHGSDGMMKMEDMQGMMQMMMPTDGDSESTKAYKQADMDMMHGMAVEYTGNPDVDFRLKMIPHHQGAIDMAKVVLQYGKDPEVRKLAEEVVKAQEGEIAMMKKWLADRGK